MSAYPFGGINFRTFVEKVAPAWTLKTAGKTRYFEGQRDGQICKIVVTFQDSQMLLPSAVRMLCHNLDVSPKDFGMNLEEKEADEEVDPPPTTIH